MKRTIEIDDDLDERVENVTDELKTMLLELLNGDKETWLESDDPPDYNDLDFDSINEHVDSAVPIYTKDIDDLWYLYSREFEESYRNHGLGNDSRDNNGMVAIYCYILDQVYEWYDNNKDDIFEEWKKQNEQEESEDDI